MLAMAYEMSSDLRRAAQLSDDLRESEDRMRLAAEAAGFGVWVWNVASNVIWGSDRWLRLFEFSPDAPVSLERLLDRVHPDDRMLVARNVRHALVVKQDYAAEYRAVLPDGRLRWVSARGRVYADAAGKPVRMVGATLDVTERKRAEHKLVEQRSELVHMARVSAVGQLAASLAHELNQPLGAIMRNAEAGELFLNEPSPDLDEVRAILADIRKDDQRAGAVIDRMRSLMRRREVRHHSLDVSQMAGEVVALAQADAGIRRVRLGLEAAPDLPPIRGDRVQLQQVMLNLVLNGMDALKGLPPANHSVVVQIRRAGPAVEVTVRDNGPGIPADALRRVFEPFFTTKPEGLGMGLAISRGIIEAHGGRIWAENDPAGGAVFTFTLPVAEEDAPQ
jgi:PAS domain S-box-containing protein